MASPHDGLNTDGFVRKTSTRANEELLISLNKNSNYCYIPRSSKHTDTCKWVDGYSEVAPCSLYKRRSYHSPTLRSAIKATFYVSHSQPFDFNFDLLQSGELYSQVRRRTTEELVFLSYRRNKMSHNGKDTSVWHTYAGFYTYPTLFYQ